MRVVIIGGVAGGMSAATRLRRLREDAEIVVFEMGEHVSYANCGLPYFVSDVISNRDDLLLQTPTSLWNRFRIEVRVNSKVTKIDRVSKTMSVEDMVTGEISESSYDYLVISTGAKPRRLEIPGIERALTLRNVTDADQIKARFAETENASAVILGAGFIGIELAENLSHLGIVTTIVQRGSTILSQFDPEMIEPLQARLVENGIRLELNSEPIEISATEVLLADGRKLPAQVVVSAAGVAPDNLLAREAGLTIGKTGGLWVDQQQRTSDPYIFAAGDAVEKLGELTGEQTLIPLANLANRHGRFMGEFFFDQ